MCTSKPTPATPATGIVTTLTTPMTERSVVALLQPHDNRGTTDFHADPTDSDGSPPLAAILLLSLTFVRSSVNIHKESVLLFFVSSF